MTQPQQPEDDFQHWIDDLLTSPAAQAPAPSTLHHQIENQYRSRQRRSLFWKSSLSLTAAASIAVMAWYSQPNTANNSNTTLNVVQQSDPPTVSAPPVEQPTAAKASFIARGDMITIPIESDDPQVTIVQVYNTTLTHRRWQQELAQQTINNPVPQPPSHGG